MLIFIIQLLLASALTFALIYGGSHTSTNCRSARCWAKIFISAMFAHKKNKS